MKLSVDRLSETPTTHALRAHPGVVARGVGQLRGRARRPRRRTSRWRSRAHRMGDGRLPRGRAPRGARARVRPLPRALSSADPRAVPAGAGAGGGPGPRGSRGRRGPRPGRPLSFRRARGRLVSRQRDRPRRVLPGRNRIALSGAAPVPGGLPRPVLRAAEWIATTESCSCAETSPSSPFAALRGLRTQMTGGDER